MRGILDSLLLPVISSNDVSQHLTSISKSMEIFIGKEQCVCHCVYDGITQCSCGTIRHKPVPTSTGV